ncbi:hypothetical protein N7490_007006 [Penicillium lividum]|nr:hypothetical protein N7490_007006 [Penicillium lividum]
MRRLVGSDTLHDTLVVARTGLDITASEAKGVPGDCAEDVCAVEQGLGELSDGDNGDGGGVVDGGVGGLLSLNSSKEHADGEDEFAEHFDGVDL